MAQRLSTIGFNAGQSEKQSVEDCVNYIPYPTSQNDLNLGAVSLYSTTGIEGPMTSSEPPVTTGFDYLQSGVYAFEGGNFLFPGDTYAFWHDRLLRFSDRSVRVIPLTFPATFEDARAVRFTSNKETLIIAGSRANGQSYVMKYDGPSDAITDVDISAISSTTAPGQGELIGITDVEYFGDRFLYMSGSSIVGSTFDTYGRVYFSKILDPDVESSLSFIGFTEDVGELRGVHVINGRLYVFSERYLSVFAKNNSTTVPFIEQQGSRIRCGLVSANSKVEIDGSLYFIALTENSFRLAKLSGGSIQYISTPAVENALNSGNWFERATIEVIAARAFSVVDAGRKYACFTFGDRTICYDVSTGLFHTRQSDSAPIDGQWDIAGSGRADSFNLSDGDGRSLLVGMSIRRDGESNMAYNAGRTNKNIGTEFGNIVERSAITAPYNSDGVTNRVAEIQVISDIDNDPLDPEWPEPTLNLSVSDDFGYSFKPEKSRKLGEQGVRNRLLRWLNLGVFRQSSVIKLRTRHPYAHQIVKMLGKFDKGFRQR